MYYKNNPDNCPHLNIGKELYYGTKTGDYICNDCGTTFMNNPKSVSQNRF